MPRKQPGPPCVICGESSIARELCEKHYRRWRRHGHTEQTRPDDWGRRDKHPLYETWKWLRRGRHGVDPRWENFWAFAESVGNRPDNCKLRRRVVSQPAGPDNWYWAEPVAHIKQGCRESHAAYAKAWRAKNPLKSKQHELRKNFGITLSEYEGMLAKQGGVCAICGGRDEWFRLAVDHCHDTKRIRGLLCAGCNRGIGLFKDSPERLARAAEYLRGG